MQAGPLPAVVDQREVQRLGGVCSRRPYSCFICTVAGLFLERGLDGARVLDLTFGEGEVLRRVPRPPRPTGGCGQG